MATDRRRPTTEMDNDETTEDVTRLTRRHTHKYCDRTTKTLATKTLATWPATDRRRPTAGPPHRSEAWKSSSTTRLTPHAQVARVEAGPDAQPGLVVNGFAPHWRARPRTALDRQPSSVVVIVD